MTLLAINIPTFERLESFSSIMMELEAEINALEQDFKELVEINVFENNSTVADQKRTLCEVIHSRSGIRIGFKANPINIGAERNVLQCYTANPDATFTWVLGDDDHIKAGSMIQILSVLSDFKLNLGLVILQGDGYITNPLLTSSEPLGTYQDFAKLAINVQPHFLIAHTLISCNIFRTELFLYDEGSYVIETLTPRLGLEANFPHMRGMIGGLLRQKETYSVIVPRFIALDTSKRLPGDVDLSSQMYKIYYFYYLWLLAELGIRVEQVPREASMWWLFRSIEPFLNLKRIARNAIHHNKVTLRFYRISRNIIKRLCKLGTRANQ